LYPQRTEFLFQTANVGDPVICNLSQVDLFGHPAFPRGAYLGGHLEADKDPGHFFGKGYLQLEFDHIRTPEGLLPVPAKIIALRGYKVDRQGKIIGHGHATRDAVEWMLPPLWPIKVLTLPARGPRPTLKGEEPLTLRLMDDVAVPSVQLAQGYPTKPSASSAPGPNDALPSRYIPAPRAAALPPSPAPPSAPPPPAPRSKFAYFNVHGHYLYGDGAYNLYPADPSLGQVLGPPNGHVFFQNGQYWAVDSRGLTWLAIRVR
jgi:hypothetical protein